MPDPRRRQLETTINQVISRGCFRRRQADEKVGGAPCKGPAAVSLRTEVGGSQFFVRGSLMRLDFSLKWRPVEGTLGRFSSGYPFGRKAHTARIQGVSRMPVVLDELPGCLLSLQPTFPITAEPAHLCLPQLMSPFRIAPPAWRKLTRWMPAFVGALQPFDE